MTKTNILYFFIRNLKNLKTKIFIFSGRYHEKKGCEIIIEAIPELKKISKKWY